jgi:hypothetical protein
MTAADIAAIFRCTPRTAAQRLTAAGVPSIRVSQKLVYWRRVEIVAYLDRLEGRSAAVARSRAGRRAVPAPVLADRDLTPHERASRARRGALCSRHPSSARAAEVVVSRRERAMNDRRHLRVVRAGDSASAAKRMRTRRQSRPPVEVIGGLVRIYNPAPGKRSTDWRLKWRVDDRARDTSATSLEAARDRAVELILELTTDVGQRLGAPLSAAVAAYVADWDLGPSHGNQQLSILRTWVLPYLGDVAVRDQSVALTEKMLTAASDVGRAMETLRQPYPPTCGRFRTRRSSVRASCPGGQADMSQVRVTSSV